MNQFTSGLMLCVGGPLDGQQVEAKMKRFAVPIVGKLSDGRPAGGAEAGPFGVFNYELTSFFVNEGEMIQMWVPVGQSPSDTMAKLLEAYMDLRRLQSGQLRPFDKE